MPERMAVPPELWKSRVTFSHQRLSVGSRTGSLTASLAGAGGVAAAGGAGELPGGAAESAGVPAGSLVSLGSCAGLSVPSEAGGA
ncbi:hypothetical protein GCM10022233_75550 [Streptomyces shaanxiensis]|uniref:Uncharacterized protein n=1 Tax=Streptomyces shaanxiensis TaxID=653357 RepID=A0ABP7W7K7_9ACTN